EGSLYYSHKNFVQETRSYVIVIQRHEDTKKGRNQELVGAAFLCVLDQRGRAAFRIFPALFLGSAVVMMISFGWNAIGSLDLQNWRRDSSWARSSRVRGTTTALTASPSTSSGMPTIAASTTSGCYSIVSSN